MQNRFIDLYSDTKTKPSPGMRKAMAEAEVGDEQKYEDPTVERLRERVCELLGKEDAVFMPSVRMRPSSIRTRRSALAMTFLSCVEKTNVVP